MVKLPDRTRDRPDATNAGAEDISAASVESVTSVARPRRRRRDVAADRLAAFVAGYMAGSAMRFNLAVGEAVRDTMDDQACEAQAIAAAWVEAKSPPWSAAGGR